MLKKTKAQGLSINVIIMAVIGLIVLVVMIYIFSKESGDTVDILGSCEARGGDCVSDIKLCDNGKIMPGMECQIKEDLCCYSIDY